jgi:hypothetical protein
MSVTSRMMRDDELAQDLGMSYAETLDVWAACEREPTDAELTSIEAEHHFELCHAVECEHGRCGHEYPLNLYPPLPV